MMSITPHTTLVRGQAAFRLIIALYTLDSRGRFEFGLMVAMPKMSLSSIPRTWTIRFAARILAHCWEGPAGKDYISGEITIRLSTSVTPGADQQALSSAACFSA
jgi:hypothetical protein